MHKTEKENTKRTNQFVNVEVVSRSFVSDQLRPVAHVGCFNDKHSCDITCKKLPRSKPTK